MKTLVAALGAALLVASPAHAASFLFNASFTYGKTDTSDGDTYSAAGQLEAAQDSAGRYVVGKARGEVTSDYGLRKTIGEAVPDFFNNDLPSGFTLNEDGSIAAASLIFIFDDDFGFYGAFVNAKGRYGTFGEVGGPLNELTITPLASVPAVPEPATWAMLIAGFGMLGATLRRRRAAIAVLA